MSRNGHLKILLTGAAGFLGTALSRRLTDDARYELVACVRSKPANLVSGYRPIVVGDLSANTDWSQPLAGVRVVIHTAARVHVMDDAVNDPRGEFRKVNVEGTLNLARQAASANVKRFIFISTVKGNGEETRPGTAFTADDKPSPVGPYAISKLKAEQGLRELAAETGMEVVIIRPPLVYGPGVKANFQRMIRWIGSGVPLPLGSTHNKRSLCSLENLISLIITCIENPAAANQIFLVGDGEDLSTTELLQGIASALGKPARLFPFPTYLITLAASLWGKRDVAQRLLGSLQVDISKTRTLLDWEPHVSLDEGLRKVADDFKKNDQRDCSLSI